MEIVMIDDASEIELTSSEVGLDIETSPRRQFLRQGFKDIQPDPRLHHMVLCQVAVEDVVYVLLNNFGSMERILRNKKITKIIHNSVFEMKFFQHEFGLPINNIWDTMIAEAITEAGRRPGLSLETVCKKLLGIQLNKDVRERFIDGSRITPEMIEYGAKDAWVLPKLRHVLEEKFYKGAGRILALEHSMVLPVVDLELNGFLLDEAAWGRQADRVHAQLLTVRDELLTALPLPMRRRSIMGGVSADVNLNSPEQLLPLFEKAGIELPDLTQKTVAEAVAQTDHPLLKLYAAYGKLNKAESTYGYGFLRHVNPVTKRVHQRVKQVETRTGRLAGAGPNLMNIPKRGGTMYRECFVARPGYRLIAQDYSQQELRVLAQFAGDKELIRAFERGIDIHAHVARILFRDKSLADDSPERQAAKTLNFGLIYGMGINSLALSLHCSPSEARELLETHHRSFPGAFSWMTDIVAFARSHGYVETILGRRRSLAIELDDFEREARNTPIQSSAADMTKLACILIHNKGLHLVNVVHDEIIIEEPAEEAEESQEVLQFCMMLAAEKMVDAVPFATDGYISTKWSKPKKKELAKV